MSDGPRSVSEPRRQAAGARADFKDEVALVQLTRFDDEIDQIDIDEEVLAEFLLRHETVLSEKIAKKRLRLPRGRGARRC